MSPLSKKIVRCKGVLVADSEIYPGFIDNVSEEDLCISVPPTMPDADTAPGQPFWLVINHPSGESVPLACRIKWSYKTPPGGLLNIIAEVMDSIPEYKDFYHRIN